MKQAAQPIRMLRLFVSATRPRVLCGSHRSNIRRYNNINTSYASSGKDDTVLKIVDLKRRCYTYQDRLTKFPVKLLKRSLNSYLSLGHEVQKDHIPLPLTHIGYQHTFLRPYLSEYDLCEDGTDVKFLPGPEQIWKYRLWAGGSVTLDSKIPVFCTSGASIHLLERVSDVRVLPESKDPNKVFVTIVRKFLLVPYFFQQEDIEHISADFMKNEDALTKIPHEFMTETENICFLREPPASFQDTRVIKVPQDSTFSHTMTPRRGLLFQFSALTYNAHSIHIDRDAARKDYGAKDLVVHGPLTQVLMVEFLRRKLDNLFQDRSCYILPRSITYTNLRPLYVDEPMTLCCKPLREQNPAKGDCAGAWNVWIQTGEGETASLAVKATIVVETPSLLTLKGRGAPGFDRILAEVFPNEFEANNSS